MGDGSGGDDRADRRRGRRFSGCGFFGGHQCFGVGLLLVFHAPFVFDLCGAYLWQEYRGNVVRGHGLVLDALG